MGGSPTERTLKGKRGAFRIAIALTKIISKILFKMNYNFVYFKIDNSILEASFKAKKLLLSLLEQNL